MERVAGIKETRTFANVPFKRWFRCCLKADDDWPEELDNYLINTITNIKF